MAKPTAQQRALWTFLIATLAVPFLAALIVLAAGAAITATGRLMPPHLVEQDAPARMHWASQHALYAFVWAAWPAALSGAAAAGLIIWRDRVGWLECAILGAVSSSLFAFVSGGGVARHALPIAFTGALLGVVMWAILTRARIVRE